MAILIVEDDSLTGLELASALERGGFRVCGPAASANEALSLARGCRPWLALIDVAHCGRTNSAELGQMLGAAYGTVVVLLGTAPSAAARDFGFIGTLAWPHGTQAVVRVVSALAAACEGQGSPWSTTEVPRDRLQDAFRRSSGG